MPTMKLTKEEHKILVLLLEGSLTDLSYEIADTDRVEFRNELKSNRELISKILNDLKKATD